MKRAAQSPTRSRPRKKAAAPAAASSPAETSTPAPAETPGARNVDPAEGAVSLGVGILMVVAALFPRTLKQFFLLSLGGGLLYRGMTGYCRFYQALGIDTARKSLLQQLNEKFLSLE